MSVNSQMTALADNIRLRLNGGTDTLSIAAMTEAVLSLPYGNIPNCHYAEAARVIDHILTWKKSHTNSLIFGAVSDAHVAHNNATYEANSKASIRHAAFALETVGMLAGCDFIANLGDNCWENGIDTDNAYLDAKYTANALRAAFSRLTAYSLPGNHDKSDDTRKLFNLVGVVNEFDDHGTTQIRGFGYKDYTDKKVRVICLNSVDYLNASGGYAMSYEQKDFLMRALDLSAKSDVAQWQILILSHIPVDFNFGDYNTYADLQTILNAYMNGATASITVNSAYALNETPSGYATYSGGKLVYNYSGKNSARIIANIHGHVHTDAYGKMANGILRMATSNACFYLGKTESYPNYGDYSIDAAISRIAGTATDTCVVFYCIDLQEQAVYAFAYGAGSDRVASYKAAAMYSVTYQLTNVTSSVNVSLVEENSGFVAVLTAEPGYELANVTVTMGGTDITGSRYSNGTLSIPSVTGNIVITATATEAVSYTNMFVEGDVQTSTRFNSAGEIVSGSFWCMATYLAVSQGDVVRVYCPNGLWTNHTQRAICTYNSAKAHVSSDFYAQNCEKSADDHTITATIPAGVAYVRISGLPHNNAAGTIITINEQIA